MLFVWKERWDGGIIIWTKRVRVGEWGACWLLIHEYEI